MLLPYLKATPRCGRASSAAEGAMVRRSRRVAARVRRIPGARLRGLRRADPLPHGLGSTETAPSPSRDLDTTTPPTWRAAARRRHEARADGWALRGATEGSAHHAGLLAPAGTYRSRVRRGGLLPPRRRVRPGRRGESRCGLLFRGRISEDFKLAPAPGACRPVARGLHRSFRAARARRRHHRHGRAELAPWFFRQRMLRGRIFGQIEKHAEHRQLQPHRAAAGARRAAVARHRRDDRQGLDQPARRARVPRCVGGGTVRGSPRVLIA